MSILELGPCEGYHTAALELRGHAHVEAMEHVLANFFKCLIVKNVYNLSAHFYWGDFGKYLAETDKLYDMILMSGVLYHQADPLAFLENAARHSRSLFIWTHYFDPGKTRPAGLIPKPCRKTFQGRPVNLYRNNYGTKNGYCITGPKTFSNWLDRESLFAVLEALGFTLVNVPIVPHRQFPDICLLAERSDV